ncbi:HPP family protein [Leisingera sp. M527]|nr:HPP family protein [Leisingera sp. M527]
MAKGMLQGWKNICVPNHEPPKSCRAIKRFHSACFVRSLPAGGSFPGRRSHAAEVKSLAPSLTGIAASTDTENPRVATGAATGICVCALFALVWPEIAGVPMRLLAALGASAVLIYAVQNSPLAQPWSAICGNVVSAAAAVAVLQNRAHALATGIGCGRRDLRNDDRAGPASSGRGNSLAGGTGTGAGP